MASDNGDGMPPTRRVDSEPGGGRDPRDHLRVELLRPGIRETTDQPLWAAIRNRTGAIAFPRYAAFIEEVLCGRATETPGRRRRDDRPRDLAAAEDFGAPSVTEARLNLQRRLTAEARDGQPTSPTIGRDEGRTTIIGFDAYNLLKLATEAFLIVECGIAYRDGRLFTDEHGLKGFDALIAAGPDEREPDESRRFGYDVTPGEIESMLASYLDTPNRTYLRRIVNALVGMAPENRVERLPYCDGILANRLSCPSLIELIWSYWHEQGMLVQTMNAILLRFQNKRRGPDDPLVNLELDPLRGLNNLLWGFLQDEANRLSVPRRAYEYDHHYGLTLVGRSVVGFQPVDSRTRFLEAFHTLLYRAMMFYREDDDATVVADGFAMLNALREVHIILGEGAHNQYGDLPWQARKEMLIAQWMLSRREIREFIRGRHMVPYQESWMGTVDDMKRLQGWSDVTVTHFHELAVYGEQVLLSVRFGDWIAINDQEHARNWARYWRPEIQRYIHAYHAVTGVDLSVEITDGRASEDRYRQPSQLIARRARPRTGGCRLSQGRTRPHRLDAPEAPPAEILPAAPRGPARR